MRTGSSGSFQFHTSAHVKTLPVCSFPPRSDITAQGDQTVEPRVGLEPKAPQLGSRPRHSVWASTGTRSWWRCKLATRFCVTLRDEGALEECRFLNTAEVTRVGVSPVTPALPHNRSCSPEATSLLDSVTHC